jgi:hypothetical protein
MQLAKKRHGLSAPLIPPDRLPDEDMVEPFPVLLASNIVFKRDDLSKGRDVIQAGRLDFTAGPPIAVK